VFIKVKKNFTILLFLILAKVSLSCSCIKSENYSLETEFKETDAVFNGTLIDIDTVRLEENPMFPHPMGEIWYTFQINDNFKGDPNAKTIKLRSGVTNAQDCKFIFLMNQSYLVFANHPLNDQFQKVNSILKTTVCTATSIATKANIMQVSDLSRTFTTEIENANFSIDGEWAGTLYSNSYGMSQVINLKGNGSGSYEPLLADSTRTEAFELFQFDLNKWTLHKDTLSLNCSIFI